MFRCKASIMENLTHRQQAAVQAAGALWWNIDFFTSSFSQESDISPWKYI